MPIILEPWQVDTWGLLGLDGCQLGSSFSEMGWRVTKNSQNPPLSSLWASIPVHTCGHTPHKHTPSAHKHIHTPKTSVAFLYCNNQLSEREIMKNNSSYSRLKKRRKIFGNKFFSSRICFSLSQKLASNSCSPCHSLPCAGCTEMGHCVQKEKES